MEDKWLSERHVRPNYLTSTVSVQLKSSPPSLPSEKKPTAFKGKGKKKTKGHLEGPAETVCF